MRFMNPVLTQFPLTRWPLLLAGGSLMLMLGAWGFQYIGGYAPCALCYDQRHIHLTVIALGLVFGVALIVRPGLAKFAPWMIFAMAAVLVYSAGFAFWHAGVEYDWWEGPATCTSTGGMPQVDLSCIIDGTDCGPIVLCDEAAWTLLGISMAGYNALISAVMAIVATLVGIKGLKS
ncbi:disulfide bond formation protein B [Maricaulis sp.]|uniref:disulfide bond formation protein B n=1 Tax=Maricaulis sp. TaxID=1486257 RepID=UPI003A8FCF07